LPTTKAVTHAPEVFVNAAVVDFLLTRDAIAANALGHVISMEKSVLEVRRAVVTSLVVVN
jgi:hypothetical protein